MSNKIKDVWGFHPRHPSKGDVPPKKQPSGPRKRVKSRYKHRKPIKNPDVSDGGGDWFILFVIFLLFLLITLALW